MVTRTDWQVARCTWPCTCTQARGKSCNVLGVMDDSRFKRRPTHNPSFVYRRSSGFARARDIARGVKEVYLYVFGVTRMCAWIYDGIICVYRMCNARKEVLVADGNCLEKKKKEKNEKGKFFWMALILIFKSKPEIGNQNSIYGRLIKLHVV